ncbi:MAG: hypothetical protein U0Q16_14370 [Bryobacteraceae bacterium]
MLCDAPERSNYDLNFRVFGFPVRIHPWFWLASLFLGGVDRDPGVVFIFVAVWLLTTLVHELGHAFAMRYYGEDAAITLHAMGGYAESLQGFWRRNYSSQIRISAAGPVAGLAFGAAVALAAWFMGASISLHFSRLGIPYVTAIWPHAEPVANAWGRLYISAAFNSLLWAAIYWDLINLLPVYPLDGGQIARAWLERKWATRGLIRSLEISAATGAVVAVASMVCGSLWTAFLFGSCAFGSWQALETYRGQGRSDGPRSRPLY